VDEVGAVKSPRGVPGGRNYGKKQSLAASRYDMTGGEDMKS
jgi:hypothetical protein